MHNTIEKQFYKPRVLLNNLFKLNMKIKYLQSILILTLLERQESKNIFFRQCLATDKLSFT